MKILLILAHPSKTSFNHTLLKQYEKSAKQNNNVKTLILSNLKFDPILHEGYAKPQPLEPDLIKAQSLIKWADKLVIFTPIWWTTPPSLFKGFIERTLLPNFAFKYEKSVFPKQLLKNKSALIIATMDSPLIYYKLIAGNPLKKLIKGTLGFCGIKPIKYRYISSLRSKTKEQRKQILNQINILASKN